MSEVKSVSQMDKFNKGLTLTEVYNRIKEDGAKNFDRMVLPSDLTFRNGFMVDARRNTGYALTKHSAAQFAALLQIPLKTFMWNRHNTSKELFSEVMAPVWDKWAKGRSKPILVRMRKEHEGALPHIRALLSSRYGILENAQFLELMAQVVRGFSHSLPDPRFRVCKVDGNGMHLELALPLMDEITLEGDDPHQLHITIGQNEIGAGKFYIGANAMRHKCLNLCILSSMFGSSSQVVHAGDVVKKLRRILGGQFQDVLDRIPNVYETYRNTQQIEVINPELVLKKLVANPGGSPLMTQGEVKEVVQTKFPIYLAEMGSTAYAIVNSITDYCRDLADRERAQVLATLAGNISQLPASKFQLQLA